jgi:hypothetical protein
MSDGHHKNNRGPDSLSSSPTPSHCTPWQTILPAEAPNPSHFDLLSHLSVNLSASLLAHDGGRQVKSSQCVPCMGYGQHPALTLGSLW